MKKFYAYTLITAIALGAAACGKNTSEEPILSEMPIVTESARGETSVSTEEPEPEPVIWRLPT